MVVKNFKDITLYFKQDSIVMKYNRQFICFHRFNKQKKGTESIENTLLNRSELDLNEMFKLARLHNMSMLGSSQIATEYEFERPVGQELFPKVKPKKRYYAKTSN